MTLQSLHALDLALHYSRGKNLFVFNPRSCNDEDCHVPNVEVILVKSGSVVAVNGFIVSLYKRIFKNDAVR